ncbi:hypothetical protein WAK64_09675 [Bacillus spongiae]|uniref:Uncharacterized protein n=1 Tax=Bacillus spongiae TaxID=2683610 RepID=A0ABU8HDA2_9BACI
MILKEFGLDLPYQTEKDKIEEIMYEKNLSHEEATRYDYEANWKQKRRVFSLETRCITSMFERLFSKFNTVDCRKIIVECVDKVDDERILNFSGVYTVQVKFSFDKFIVCNDRDKKNRALNLLMEGIEKINIEKKWENTTFEDVYNKIIRLDYKNEWMWGKTLKSPKKDKIAVVLCQHEVKEMSIFIVLKDMQGIELERKKIITELPDEFAYAKHLGKIKWVSDNEVRLYNKKGTQSWSYLR